MKKPSKFPALPAPPTPSTNIFELDPDQHRVRMYHEITKLLDRLKDSEHLTVMEHTKILATINTIEKPAAIVKAEPDGERTGTVVSKYKGAFTAKSDAASRRKANAGPAPEPEPDDWFESADRAEDDGESDSDDAA